MKGLNLLLSVFVILIHNTSAHPELFQIPWLLPSLDSSNQFAQFQQQQAFATPTHQSAVPTQTQQVQPAPAETQAQVVVPQRGYTYQASQPALQASNSPQAFGVAQRSESQPLPSFDTDRLAPLQPSTLPPLLTFPPQYPSNQYQQQALQSNSVTLPPNTATYAPPAYAATQPPVAEIAPAAAAMREPPVQNFWFKEGTPILPCGYGVNPLPQYNTPRKRCVPFSPLCGFAFSCIMDV